MKIAVVGGGSTYTPELVDGFGRLQDVLPVDELVLVDPDRERLELVGAFGRRILDRLDHPGTRDHLDRARPGARRCGRRAAPAAGGRPGGPPPGRDLAAGVRLRRAGDHRSRVGSPRRCAPSRSCSTSPSRSRRRRRTRGSSTSPTRSASSPGPCSRRVIARSACATSRSGSSAASPAYLDVEPDRVQLDHVGLNHLTWERAATVDGVDRLPGDPRAARRRSGRRHRAAGGAHHRSWAWCRRTTCATSTPTTRWSASCGPASRVPRR